MAKWRWKWQRNTAPFVRKIEVEVENLDMVREAVDAGADIIMHVICRRRIEGGNQDY